MYCVTCGKEVTEGAKFCSFCGAKMKNLQENSTQTEQEQQNTGQYQEASRANANQQERDQQEADQGHDVVMVSPEEQQSVNDQTMATPPTAIALKSMPQTVINPGEIKMFKAKEGGIAIHMDGFWGEKMLYYTSSQDMQEDYHRLYEALRQLTKNMLFQFQGEEKPVVPIHRMTKVYANDWWKRMEVDIDGAGGNWFEYSTKEALHADYANLMKLAGKCDKCGSHIPFGTDMCSVCSSHGIEGAGGDFTPTPPRSEEVAMAESRSIASLIMGICGIVGGFFMVGVILGPLAIVFGRRARQVLDDKNNNFYIALAGIITGGIGLGISILSSLYWIIFIVMFAIVGF